MKLGWKVWLGIAILVVAIGVVGGPLVYTKFIAPEAAAPLSLSSPDNAGESLDSYAGTWTVAQGSTAGYRVDEVLFGRNNTATGRTSKITGSMDVSGTTITRAKIVVDMAAVTSDEDRRDNQFRGRIMNVSQYPTSTFEFTEPIDLKSVPAEGEEVAVPVTGKLTMHGTTKTVAVNTTGRINGSKIEVVGSIPVVFAEWNIPNPSFAAITTEDHGTMEFALVFNKS